MRGLGAIGAVIFLVPAMIYGAFQVQIMLKVNEVINETMNFESTEDRLAEAVAEESGEITFAIIDTRGQSLAPARASALLAPKTLDRNRDARVSTIIDAATLLEPGEQMPQGEMRDVMVEARTARYADALCDQLIATLADQCGVVRYSTEEITYDTEKKAPDWADLAGYYVVETHAIFTPSAPVGTFPEADTLVYQTKDFDLEPWTIPGAAPDAIAARLGEVLTAAELACSELRRVHGNCVVSEIEFDIRQFRPDSVIPSFEIAYFSRLQTTALAE